jgi:BASS family bile acid:Na+ symporter
MTPFNIGFWAKLNPHINEQIASKSFHLDPLKIGLQVLFLLLLPLVLGMLTSAKLPRLGKLLRKFLGVFSIVVFFTIVIGAMAVNWTTLVTYANEVIVIVLVQNLFGLGIGFAAATLFKLAHKDRRAVTIEVGMQNITLGLIIMVTQFPPEMRGGMMMVGAMWGIWGNCTGFALAFLWRRRTRGTLPQCL